MVEEQSQRQSRLRQCQHGNTNVSIARTRRVRRNLIILPGILSGWCLPIPVFAFQVIEPALQSNRLPLGFPVTTQLHAMENDPSDGFDDNPDVSGVFVDGYPLPAIPKFNRTLSTTSFLHSDATPRLEDWTKPVTSRSLLSHTASPLRVLVAGGGLGGLAVASQLQRLRIPIQVLVVEQARQYQPFGGPIQLQSNALWALEQIDPVLLQAIQACGVVTGDRLSGIKDGKRYQEGWLVKFDAATPALRKGLPLTLAINRVALQEILLTYGFPRNRVVTNRRVVSYHNVQDTDGDNDSQQSGVQVDFQDGSHVYADILIGADGIWSRVRHQMMGLPSSEVGPSFAAKHASYSGYTCYTGTCRHTPADIHEVAYKVFLGQEQYLGCTDTGHGWQHWWAFLPDPPPAVGEGPPQLTEGCEQETMYLERLLDEFQDWSPEILDLFRATDPEVVKKRPLFDRPPMWKNGWVSGNVALMGDAAHPTMPNLGQGGAMAIEDAYVLGQELQEIQHTNDIHELLKSYERRRFLRASIAQFLSRNGSDLLVDWDKVRNTPILGPIAMKCVNIFQPMSMDFLYSADF